MQRKFFNNLLFNSLMKKFLIISIVLFLGSCFLMSSNHPADDGKKYKVLLELINQLLSVHHFQPKDVNDGFSKIFYDFYVKRMDVSKRYLLQQDVDQLDKYKSLIDDQLRTGSYEFFEATNTIVETRNKEAQVYYKEILAKPFDFEKDDSFELDPEKRAYARTQEELREIWYKLLKYEVMTKVATSLDVQDGYKNNKDTTHKVKTFTEIEQEARDKVKQSYDEFFHRLDKVDKVDRLYGYVNSFVSCFDPHTEYFPPKEKANFDIAMSGRLEGIGATLQSDPNGYIKVVEIVPGSASWKQGQLKAGDVILKVAQQEKEPVDIVDMRLDDAVQLIRGPKGTLVKLTIKKPDASIVVIPIVRDVVIIEETYAKSAVITDKKGKMKYGYIFLPKFYKDFNSNTGPDCAVDIKNEINKLKEDGVEGIILDLRNNGGGSLPSVIKMGGLFVKKGPIVQVKARNAPSQVQHDFDPAVEFSGPLVIMVNTGSASASEILAAAMQDFHRAVIVGSTTYGKGTVQQFMDIDEMLPSSFNDVKPLGSFKVTTQKFYRINGGTTQLKGVVPDIILPDYYSYLDVGEKDLDFALPFDTIPRATYDFWSLSQEKLEKIKQKANERINENKNFKLIDEYAQLSKKRSDSTVYTLNLTKYRSRVAWEKELNKKYDVQKSKTGLEFIPDKADKLVFDSDTIKNAKFKNWSESLSKDIYIEECTNILKDIR